MTTLAILLILFVLIGYGLKEYYQIKLGKPISTPPAVIDELIEFLSQYSPSGRFIDMGSGWGSLVLKLSKRLPEWQVDGIEAAPTPWFIANCRSIGRNADNYRFFIGRMETQMLQNYDVVFLHQPTRNLTPLLPRLARALQSDTFVITYPHPLPRLPDPDILLSAKNDRLYLYRGMEALAYLNPPPATAPEVPLEPAQEPTPVPADNAEPTDDNAFEQTPADTVLPADDASEGPHEQAQLPLNQTD